MESTTAQLVEAVRNYKIPQPALELLRQHSPLILAAITAAGKTTTAARIIEKSNYRHVITHTTRKIRPGEAHGINYWFVDEPSMLRMIEDGKFVEVQTIHGSAIYGVSLEAYWSVVKNGLKPLLIVDVQGIKEIITDVPAIQPYFILPPSFDEWMNRLHKRGQISHIEKSRRLESALKEIETALSDPHFVLVINHDVEQTADEILKGPRLANQHAAREVAQRLVDHIKT